MRMRTFAKQIPIFGDTVKKVQLGKLNPDQFPNRTINKIAQFIWDLEADKQLKSPINPLSDLFSMPLSYLNNMETMHLEFVLHIPLTRPEQILDMHRYHPFPMTMTNVRCPARPGTHNLLAYNRKKEYQTKSTTDIQTCWNGHETITIQEGLQLQVDLGCQMKLEQ